MKIDPKNLPQDVGLLHQILTDLLAVNQLLETEKLSLKAEYQLLETEYQLLEERLKLLLGKRFGKSSEKLDKKIEDVQERIEDHALSNGIQNSEDESSEDTDVNASEETAAEKAKRKPKRKKLPENLERTDVQLAPDPVCPGCGGENFRKISDDVSEKLEYIPGSFKVIRYTRPRCACVNCETVVQAYAPYDGICKGKAGSGLLAHVLVQKYCNHLPLYRQSEIYAREGIDLSRSTLCGWMYQCSQLLQPLIAEIRKVVFAADQIHGDDTTVRVLAPELGKTKTGRIWTYVMDGRPWGDDTPPAVCYFYSPDRRGERPAEHLQGFAGILHADAYAGYDCLYDGVDPETQITEAACWAHTRRKFYEVTQANDNASIAIDALEKIGAIYGIEEEIKGLAPEERQKARQKRSKDLVEKLFISWKKSYAALPKKSMTAKAIAYAQNNQVALMRFLDNGKIEIDNNAAERAMRSIAIGRKNWLFAGSDRGGETAAAIYSLIETAKLNGVNPWTYLRHVLTVIQDHKASKVHELLPWNVIL